MKKLQWNMEEVFYFPENVGVPKDARLVKVKAGFTEKRSEDAVRLSGVYHIAAKVEFTEGQRSESIPTDAIFVDDVELEGKTGYFEYAVPLNIDLPPEVDRPLHIEATDVKSTFDGQGSFTVAWNVNCTYAQETAEEVASKETASKETASKETAKKETEIAEEKSETAAVQDAPREKVVAGKQEQAQAAQMTESRQTFVAQNRTAAAPVQEPQAAAMHDSSIWNAKEDILSYIATLPDEWTTTRFRSNDIFVKEES
ncbi:hypothetical protein [Sporosarcina luteola]|uniref:hypothetical protein n=1 Tax=Sporosarcina luteola TaxID=582850 RepID=UPI00203A4E9D|nr:hypothetical protein [Sporosarcina luteola]MCM3710746.1 hypothetical protein [Sporosarcina luteola]